MNNKASLTAYLGIDESKREQFIEDTTSFIDEIKVDCFSILKGKELMDIDKDLYSNIDELYCNSQSIAITIDMKIQDASLCYTFLNGDIKEYIVIPLIGNDIEYVNKLQESKLYICSPDLRTKIYALTCVCTDYIYKHPNQIPFTESIVIQMHRDEVSDFAVIDITGNPILILSYESTKDKN